ncbi:glycosyltransferase [Providencia hangzhouensis]|uniref:glycosyltransferase n=1 Tax=Providencia hangzhouensis TaxID=3031799 RepID=UPI0034DDC0E3
MKIIAFLGEKYSHYDGMYYTNPTSAAFLQKMMSEDNIYIVSPSINSKEKPQTYSSKVREDKFIESPFYTSTKDFILKCLFKRKYYKNFIVFSDHIIKSNPDATFWIRTPSIGSVLFGLRVIKNKKRLINHMCADIKDTWRDKKYSILEKYFGFLTSRILRTLLGKICANKNTINLATGSALEKFGLKYSAKAYQFVDLMSEKPNINLYKDQNYIKNDETFRLTFVGRLVEDKGIIDLINIMEKLPKHVTLNVIGGGDAYEDALNLIEKNKLKDRVIMYGQLPFSELTKIYNKTDLTVVPSNNFYEGFPRVIMESWAHGVPVIVSNVGGVSAFVKHNVNGLVCQPGDTDKLDELIKNIINDKDLYMTIKHGASELADISTFEYWSNKARNIVTGN